MQAVWRQVKHRRWLYVASLLLTFALFLMPIWASWFAPPPFFASGHGLLGWFIALLAGILPAFLTGLITTWADHPLLVLLLAMGLLVSNGLAGRKERKLRDDARRIWDEALVPLTEAEKNERVQRAEETRAVPQPEDATPAGEATARFPRLRQFVRWRVLPGLVLLLFLLIAAWLVLTLATRLWLAFAERDGSFCARISRPEAAQPFVLGTRAQHFLFDTRRPCHATGMTVRAGDRYIVEMFVTHPWSDGGEPADPRGLSASQLGLGGYLGMPLRRAVRGRYLQPVVHILGDRGAGPAIQPLELQQRGAPLNLWRGEFVAQQSGELSLFANEAVLPLPGGRSTFFYTGQPYHNRGTAMVRIVAAHIR